MLRIRQPILTSPSTPTTTIVWIKAAGIWRQATPFIKISGTWR